MASRVVPDLPIVVQTSRDVITASGPDAVAYLQGQISQDVERLATGDSAWSFVLQPQGKVDAWFRVTRTGADSFLLDVDHGSGESMLARLERFKLRTKCEFELTTMPTLAIRGTAQAVSVDGAQAVSLQWPVIEGHDLLVVNRGVAEALAEVFAQLPDGSREGTLEDLDAIRISGLMPAMGTELTESTIPAEAGVVDASASFTKGCYVGQELVARVDSRGNNTPRRLRLVIGEGQIPVAGASVIAGDAEIGAVTSSAAVSDGFVALAYIKRSAAEETGATIEGSEVSLHAH